MRQLSSTLALFLILASLGLEPLSLVDGMEKAWWQNSNNKAYNNCMKMVGAPCNKAGDRSLRSVKLWYYPPSPKPNGSHQQIHYLHAPPPPPPSF
ncbi:hypothetical protein KSS87_001192 [Heliosperma pusillum]|nr:hypothetical protein KSS87_001192 [Heliosperma pusillum]